MVSDHSRHPLDVEMYKYSYARSMGHSWWCHTNCDCSPNGIWSKMCELLKNSPLRCYIERGRISRLMPMEHRAEPDDCSTSARCVLQHERKPPEHKLARATFIRLHRIVLAFVCACCGCICDDDDYVLVLFHWCNRACIGTQHMSVLWYRYMIIKFNKLSY